MTTDRRFERTLPDILEDLYLGPTPDYRNEVLAAAVRTRQRPGWTFPGRWLPMTDLATRARPATRLPLRTITVALLILALIAVALVAYVGSHQNRVPAPFGIARNGVIAYAVDGDIYTADPISGTVRAVVTGPELDRAPRFSRDGTRIAFLRQAGDGSTQFNLAVVARDGGTPAVITTAPMEMPELIEWSADSASIFVNSIDARLTR